MKIRRKYTPIYKNATALLRPKTGLNDMVIELDPGQPDGRAGARSGATVPIDQTLPNVNFDEILVLAGHRHAHLPAAARRRRGRGARRPGQGRCRPTSSASSRPAATWPSSTARWPCASATSAASIHNFRLLSQALGDKDDELAALVDSSNRGLHGLRQPGRATCARRCRSCPARCDTTNTTLAKVDKLGKVLGPTLGALRPGARALGPSLVADAAVPAARRRRSSRTSCGPSRAPRCRWSRSCARRPRTSRSSRPS